MQHEVRKAEYRTTEHGPRPKGRWARCDLIQKIAPTSHLNRTKNPRNRTLSHQKKGAPSHEARPRISIGNSARDFGAGSWKIGGSTSFMKRITLFCLLAVSAGLVALCGFNALSADSSTNAAASTGT